MTTKQTINENFVEFHTANLSVYQELRALALKMKRSGREHYGIKSLFEVLRWHRALKTSDTSSDFKLNNNYTALYARVLMQNEPELEGFFRTRKRLST